MLTAELRNAPAVIALDAANERHEMEEGVLATALTRTSWTVRVPGRLRLVTVANTALWMLTCSNPNLSTRLARRSVRVRFDSRRGDTPAAAELDHGTVAYWAKKHRARLVHAALVLIQAWIAAGRPMGHQHLGSFEHWAAVMSGVLEVAGVNGFLGSEEESIARADGEGGAWRDFTLAWWTTFGSRPVYIADLNELCDSQDLMLQIRGGRSARSQQSRLGRALASARDRVFNDLRVAFVRTERTGRTLYALEPLGVHR